LISMITIQSQMNSRASGHDIDTMTMMMRQSRLELVIQVPVFTMVNTLCCLEVNAPMEASPMKSHCSMELNGSMFHTILERWFQHLENMHRLPLCPSWTNTGIKLMILSCCLVVCVNRLVLTMNFGSLHSVRKHGHCSQTVHHHHHHLVIKSILMQ